MSATTQKYLSIRIISLGKPQSNIVRCRNSKNVQVNDKVFRELFAEAYKQVGVVTRVVPESNSVYVDISIGVESILFFNVGDILMVAINK